MAIVQLEDKTFTTYISSKEIQDAVKEVAAELNNTLSWKNPLFLGILNGSFRFASDLLSYTNFDCHISFVKISSYLGTGSSGIIREIIGLNEDISNRTVVIVEDIVDSGDTIGHIINQLEKQNPSEIIVCTCLFKPAAYKKNIHIDYAALQIENDFVVGYGLDYNGLGRNLNDIYILKE